MGTRTTPPDNKMRVAALDRIDDRVLYIEGTVTSTGIVDVSTTVISVRGGPPEVIYDSQGGCISLACNTNGIDYHVIWLEYDATDTYVRVMYCKSEDGGSTWGTPVQIAICPSGDDGFSSVRIMSDSEGRVFVLFHFEDDSEYPGPNAYQVHLYRSDDGGDSWNQIQTFTYADDYCDIQIDSNDDIYVLYWSDVSPYYVVCRKSTDHGATFGAEVQVSDFSASNFKAELDDSDNLHVIYARYGLAARNPRHCVSTDGGASFSVGHLIYSSPYPIWQFPGAVPWFTIDGSDIHFVWGEDVYENIVYSYSDDSGTTWDPYVDTGFSHNVDFGDELEVYQQGSQCVLYDGSTILYVFGIAYPGILDYLGSMTSGDGGATWTQASIVGYGKNNHWHPSLATYFTTVVAQGHTYFFLA